jgi:hypothetical protein
VIDWRRPLVWQPPAVALAVAVPVGTVSVWLTTTIDPSLGALALIYGIVWIGVPLANRAFDRAWRRECELDEALAVLASGASSDAQQKEIALAQTILGVPNDGIYGPLTARACRKAVRTGAVSNHGWCAKLHYRQTGESL